MERTNAITAYRRPLWSVMVPTYNPNRRFLEETLRCVLEQDQGQGRMQIEVVDDCSVVGSALDVVNAYAGERVMVHREETNRGLAAAWNLCIQRAQGEIIHILHQDDLVFPGFYEAMEDVLRRFPEAGAAFCRHAYIDEEGKQRAVSKLELEVPGLIPHALEHIIQDHGILCASIVVRRSTYERLGGFDPRLVHALDWEMWIRIANTFPIAYVPDILACWRQHANATTAKQIVTGANSQDFAKAIGIWSAYVPREKRQRLEEKCRRNYAISALGLAEYLLREGHKDGFEKQMEAAQLCDQSAVIRWRSWLLRMKVFIRPTVRRILGRH